MCVNAILDVIHYIGQKRVRLCSIFESCSCMQLGLLEPLTCAVDRTGMHLTVITPTSSQCTAAVLQGNMAGQHTLTQVLIIQTIVALLPLHWWRWKMIEGRESSMNKQWGVKDQMRNKTGLAQWLSNYEWIDVWCPEKNPAWSKVGLQKLIHAV